MDGFTASERSVLDAVARAGPDGILLSTLRQQLIGAGTCDARDVTEGVRMLMSSQKVAVARSANGGDHVVSLRRPQMSENFSVVLGVVKAAGASGIDVTGIIARTKVPKAEITKALNAYVQQQVVRETRCFTNKAKKLYIAAEFEPSAEVTGGTFYTESRDLDTALIDLARQRITSHVMLTGAASVYHLKKMLDSDSRVAQRRISVKEVGTLARTLQLDGVLKRARPAGQDQALHDVGERTYTSAVPPGRDASSLGVKFNRLSENDAWAAAYPCTSCPQLMTCQKHGVVSPLTCAYLRDWLTVDSGGGGGSATSPTDMGPPTSRPSGRKSDGQLLI